MNNSAYDSVRLVSALTGAPAVFTVLLLLLTTPSVSGTAEAAAELWSAESVQEEFDELYRKLRASHYDLFANRPREEYDAEFELMYGTFSRSMTRAEIQEQFQRFVALGNVAHAKIDPSVDAWERFRDDGGRAFPAYFRVIDDRVFVNEVAGGHALSVGDEVQSVDGTPALAWLAVLRAQVSADSDYLAHTLMENLLPLLVWQEWGERERFSLSVMRGAEVVDIDVPALSRSDTDASATDRFFLDWNLREARMLGERLAYLRPGPFYDNRPDAVSPWDSTSFRAFVDDAFVSFGKAGAETVLIDLRNNPGGNNDFSDHLIAWFADKPFRFSDSFHIRVSEAAIEANHARLALQAEDEHSVSNDLAVLYGEHEAGNLVEYAIALTAPRTGQRFDGEVFMLVNRHSYSNAVSVAAIGQDYGFATILGEATADLANTYGAVEHFVLPRTRIDVTFPKARILRPSGDIASKTVIPDVLIPTPLASQRDTVLEKAIEIIDGMTAGL